MEQHNRKSYLAPPAPKAIGRDGSRESVASAKQLDSSKPRFTPTSGEIPLNIPHDVMSHLHQSPGESRSAVDNQTMGFEHLSLANRDRINSGSPRSARQHRNHRSAEPSPSRPFFPSRSAIPPGGLPMRPAPPPSGPLPTPPSHGESGSWRSYSHRV